MNKKKIGIALALCLAMFATGCGCEKKEEQKKEPDIKVNSSKGITREQTVEGLKFKNTSLTSQNGIATLVTEVSNTTGQDKSLQSFNIIIKDKKGNVLVTAPGYVGEAIPDGATRTITTSFDQELKDADSVEYTINKAE